MTAGELLELSDENEARSRGLLDAERRAYAAGYRDGHADACREADEDWRRMPPLRIAAGVTYAELERRRYGAGGREHFGDPRPGDYTGKDTAA